MPWHQTPSRKKKAVVFTTVTTNAYQDQINAGFSKVCEIFKVRSIESLKYVREFYTPVCYCGYISTPRNVTLNETNCDWLFVMSVKRPHGWALANESYHLFSQSVWRSGYARLDKHCRYDGHRHNVLLFLTKNPHGLCFQVISGLILTWHELRRGNGTRQG